MPSTRRELSDVDRLERQHWCIRVPLVGLTDAAGPLDEFQWTAEIKVEAFAALVREEVERRGLKQGLAGLEYSESR